MGLPQRSGTSRKRSKYSWKERYAASRVKPAATRRATLSTTEIYAPLELVFLHDEGIEAPRHGARGVRFAIDWELRDHSLRGRELALAAERHEHRGRTDGGVETLAQALVRAHVQIGHEALHALGDRGALPMRSIGLGGHYMGSLVLRCAIGIQNSREISTIASPRHVMSKRGLSVTVATTTASRFSSCA